MKWIVTTKDKQSIELSEIELLDMLFNKLLQDTKDLSRDDFDALIKVFAIFMQERKANVNDYRAVAFCVNGNGLFLQSISEKMKYKVGEVSEESINLSNDESSKESTN